MAPPRTNFNALPDAMLAVIEEGMSESQASRLFSVNRATLRTRLQGKVDLEVKGAGSKPIFNTEQELKLGRHLEKMAGFGYGYTRTETIEIASQYAVSLNIREPGSFLTPGWYRHFVGRWPNLRLKNSKTLDIDRAKAATTENLLNYFGNLELCLDKYNLKETPEFIYNIDKKAFVPTYKTPKVLSSRKRKLLYYETPTRGSTTTVFGCGNAAGHALPPYFAINKGPAETHLQHATAGASGTSTDNGCSNTVVFNKYMREHFLPNLVRPDEDQTVLAIYDGHKSHVSVDLLDWAATVNIKLFVLPAHTSHFLQPLEVGCFSPLEARFTALKQERMRYHQSGQLDISDTVQLGCEAYKAGLKAANLQSAFRKTGVYPFKGLDVVDDTYIKQAELYLRTVEQNKCPVEHVEPEDNIRNNQPIMINKFELS